MSARALRELLSAAAGRWPEKTAISAPDGKISFSLLEKRALALEAAVRKADFSGERALICAKNSLSYAISFLALSLGGIVPVPIHTGWPTERLLEVEKGAKPLFALVDGAGERVLGRLTIPKAVLGDFAAGRVDISTLSGLARGENGLGALALIYTSASSGSPKGVIIGENPALFAADAIAAALDYRPDDKVLCGLPFAFDYGLYQLFLTLKSGAELVLLSDFSNPLDILPSISEEKITIFPLVPPLASLLLRSGLLGRGGADPLRLLTSTGDVFHPPQITRLFELLPRADIRPMYGLTECKRVSIMPRGALWEKTGSCGLPLAGTRVKVVGADGAQAPCGESGELWVAGPH
ncbi:acyl--CoA ligase, partial [bacterium]